MTKTERALNITIVVDNDSWIIPYVQKLHRELEDRGHVVSLARTHGDVKNGDIAFYLGCIHLTPPDVLARHKRNLTCHESDLPRGRGFSPLTWQVIEGCNEIPICLFELAQNVDSGPVHLRRKLCLKGHELIDELRDIQGNATVEMCLHYVDEGTHGGEAQSGEPTFYRRRTPADSELDTGKTLEEQFDLLRTVDNAKYPAWFRHKGRKYILHIQEAPDQD